MPSALYTPANCREPAYQVDWSYSLLWKAPPPHPDAWLRERSAKDHIRILQHEFKPPGTSQFLLSTTPQVAPGTIVQRTKGRLQHMVCADLPRAFRRNDALRSVGSTRRERLERYLAMQLDHHPMADRRVQERFARYQIHQGEVDLAAPTQNAHARHCYNLHVVLVHDARYREIRDDALEATRHMILQASRAKGHRLSRAAVLGGGSVVR